MKIDAQRLRLRDGDAVDQGKRHLKPRGKSPGGARNDGVRRRR